MTALDDLCPVPFHAAGAPARARVMARLADTELAAALADAAPGDVVTLRRFDLPGTGTVALACDGEDRLAAFLGPGTPFVALPGRVLAGLLRAEGVGLLVNPGAPSEMLLDAAAVDWLATALIAAPEATRAALTLRPPDPAVAAALGPALAARLADLRGLVAGAALAGADPAAGGAAHLLLLAGAEPARESRIAKALAETLAFLPPQPGGVDIVFSDHPPPTGSLVFDLSPPAPPPPRPKGPPILR